MHASVHSNMKQQETATNSATKENMPGSELWTDGLICAFEYTDNHQTGCMDKPAAGSHWLPIGWDRISELTQRVQADGGCWTSEYNEFTDAAWPTWWCHVAADHSFTHSWLHGAQWLHSDVRDRLLRYEYDATVDHFRFQGGMLFDLKGKSVGNPFADKDDSTIVLRSLAAQNFLISVLNGKETAKFKGITEVQELLAAGGTNAPRTIQEVIAQLVSHLSHWDDRVFSKYLQGADLIELKFMKRRNHEDMNLLGVILNREILMLSIQLTGVIRSLRDREKSISELLRHLRGNAARGLLEGVKKNTRETIKEQEAAFRQLSRIEKVIQSYVSSWLKDRSLRVAHNLKVFGVCCLFLLVITKLFAINVDGIPGAKDTPYAFALFCGLLVLLVIVLFTVGIRLNKPITERIAE
ncbi:hypothetical protein MKW92_008072 [Papaver armeniacum]|nr:hypothetical protein MKW92_008072 [Papaver armeniacum]